MTDMIVQGNVEPLKAEIEKVRAALVVMTQERDIWKGNYEVFNAMWVDAEKELAALRAAQPAPVGEPVGWEYLVRPDVWKPCTQGYYEQHRLSGHVRALYLAAPAPSQEVEITDEMVERGAEALWDRYTYRDVPWSLLPDKKKSIYRATTKRVLRAALRSTKGDG